MASLWKKCKNRGRGPLLQQRIDQMIGNTKQHRLLSDLPPEVIRDIAKKLPALSVVSLSQSCSAIYTQLSNEEGNNVYYEVLPPALLMEEEVTISAGEQQLE